MVARFFVYGVSGWCMEIIWTGLVSFYKKDYSLESKTSIYMFFIYGLAVFFEPIYKVFSHFPAALRGGLYCFIIFGIEFLVGSAMKTIKICPWDYSGAKYNIKGVIRLDYAPLWLFAGLYFEFVYLFLSK
ncbi:MAG: hypothetical protein LBV08_05885 [Clostridiales bacterium]|jgi:uncharacterized membrane protein|nr:hypothetical protein [Clostridiales bacterium]